MTRLFKWMAAVALLLLMVLAGVAVALQLWVGSEDFRSRVARQASSALGVPVVIGNVTVDLWPLPAVGMDKVQIQSQPPLTLERVEARPSWAPLLKGRLEIATLVVRNAVVPQAAVAAIAAVYSKQRGPAPHSAAGEGPGGSIGFLPRRTVLDQVTWVNAKGARSTLDAQARLDEDGLPASVSMTVTQGRFEGAQATLERKPDHWAMLATVGGGTVNGKLQLTPGAKGRSLLHGQFDTSGVEVAVLTAPSRTLTGRLEAQTSLRSEYRGLAALADTLHSQTRFTVRDAVLHGVDLAQAVKSAGSTRGGETRLETLAGTLVTQGRSMQLNNLAATSGVLSANGHVAMAPDRALSGKITVDLVPGVGGGTIGVPLAVGGTLDAPTVTVSRGALLGAAVGTLMSPGVGTGVGAKLGDRLEEGLRGLFGK